MSWGQDILCLLRGLQAIAEAGLKLQESNLKTIWSNSSVRNAAQDVVNKVKSPGNLTASDVAKTINDTGGRIYTVLHGVREYVAYTPSTKVSESEFVKTAKGGVKPESKTERFEKDFEIKLTESDKQLLKKLDLEYQEKMKAAAKNEKQTQQQQQSTQKDTPKKAAPKDAPIKPSMSAFNLENVKTGSQVGMGLNVENVTLSAPPPVHTTANVELIKPNTPPVTAIPNPKSRLTLSPCSKQRTVPSTRISRLVSFGSLAAGLGIGTAAEYARRSLGFGENESNLFLTQANMDRIVDTLCKVRGAALKIGQIMSIQDETVISAELAKALERVRKSADFMPRWQIENVMKSELGEHWHLFFSDFEETPFAAASIGQVHWAKTRSGEEVAIKIQYPGVAKGIESDIDNLIGIMKVWNVFPKGMFVDNLVAVAKRELAWEVDYLREADCTRKFKQLLAPYPEYYVPKVIDHLCTSQVFTTEYVQGIPVDQCLNIEEEHKKFIAKKIMDLCLLEILEFRYMQTDPNWANFLYEPNKKQLILLDFGASREYSKSFIDKYVRIIKAAAENDRKSVLLLSRELGFLTGYESKIMEEAHVDAVMILGEVFRHPGEFDFSGHQITSKIQNLVPTMLAHRLCPPPEEIYSLHRKLSGVFLLCSKLKVSIPMRSTFLELYNKYKFDEQATK